MKIKTRPDAVGMLEGDELFRMNGWLAELRDEGRAESRDDSTESGDDGRARSRESSYAWSRDDGQAGSRGDGRAEPRDFGPLGPWDDGQAGPGEDGRARPRGDGQARRPQPGYPRPEPSAARSATRAVARAENTARALIGDDLRLPIMWCEIGSCVSWFAHPGALGEADVRARAIDAGWRVDAVGLLACPQCLQTAPGFQSPLPVVVWDREEAIAMSAQIADEPSADAIATVAQELSHDLRRPVSSHPDEVAAASAWMAAVPADDVAQSTGQGTSDEIRRPTGDHEPESHLRPGRHRKRLAARLMLASG
jgi:hypothetical protein